MTIAQNSNKQISKPNKVDILRELKRDIGVSFNAVNIGIIQSFDAATQSATVKLALKSVVAVAADGTRTLQERPILLDCPCFFAFGGGAFLSMPIQPGDNCIVLFNDREIDNWYVNGGTQAPNSYRTHSASDAFALVGIKNLQTAIGDYITNGIRLSYNANTRITLTDENIASIANLFTHTGSMQITGDLTILGTTHGNASGDWHINANIKQDATHTIHAGNGATGTFNFVNVVDGIVVGGS